MLRSHEPVLRLNNKTIALRLLGLRSSSYITTTPGVPGLGHTSTDDYHNYLVWFCTIVLSGHHRRRFTSVDH